MTMDNLFFLLVGGLTGAILMEILNLWHARKMAAKEKCEKTD